MVIKTMSCVFTLHTNIVCIMADIAECTFFVWFLPEKQIIRVKNPITYVFVEEICSILAVFFYISN